MSKKRWFAFTLALYLCIFFPFNAVIAGNMQNKKQSNSGQNDHVLIQKETPEVPLSEPTVNLHEETPNGSQEESVVESAENQIKNESSSGINNESKDDSVKGNSAETEVKAQDSICNEHSIVTKDEIQGNSTSWTSDEIKVETPGGKVTIQINEPQEETKENKENGNSLDKTGGKPDISVSEDTGETAESTTDPDDTTVTSDGKTIEICVEVEGLPEGLEVTLTLLKEANGDEPGLVIYQETTGHMAVFHVTFGGSCTVNGAAVSGYSIPSPIVFELIKLNGDFVLEGTINYEVSEEVLVTGLSLTPEEIFMLTGEITKVTAAVLPANATNQWIIWQSFDETVAEVSNGVVTAIGPGQTKIKATTSDGGYSQYCEILVAEIIEISVPETITVCVGEIVLLPAQVEVILSQGNPQFADVNWIGALSDGGIQHACFYESGTYQLFGEVSNTSLQACITIVVTGNSHATPPETAELNLVTLGLYVGNTQTLTATVPSGTTDKSLFWISSNPLIASVNLSTGSTTEVTGQSAGTTVIKLKNSNGLLLAVCLVSVTLNPVLPEDEVLIIATTLTSELKVDEFDEIDDVYIRGFNLEARKYYVKIMEKGSTTPLGKGDITFCDLDFNGRQVVFNLFEKVPYSPTDNLSKEYFMYLSREPDFPMGDEEDGTPRTLMTNFRVGSPVPTGEMVVSIKELVGDVFVCPGSSSELIGLDVILARPLDGISVIDLAYEDYLNPLYQTPIEEVPDDLRDRRYTEEVKMIGKICEGGSVAWTDYRESLAIGGYILLVELPDGYMTDLNESTEGILNKEVQIARDEITFCEVKVMPIGSDITVLQETTSTESEVDEVYIASTTEEFLSKEDVWINGYNLESGIYYIKVTDKGSKVSLGEGSVEFSLDDVADGIVTFNLYSNAPFSLTDNKSMEYFIYMSKFISFPMGDDGSGVPLTLTTNFRIGSPVPTGNIVVNIHEMFDGDFVDGVISSDLVGTDVILAREIDGKAAVDVGIEDYLNPLYGSTNEDIPIEYRDDKYNDEVKLHGHISENGTVIWETPEETLKIGGYYLLIDLPESYHSNLNLYYPYTDDGTLVKEVHLIWNEVVIRDIYLFE